MTQQIINVGTLPNDGEGDPLRVAFQKINENFTQTFTAPGAPGTDGSFQYRNLNSLRTAAFYDVRWVLGGLTQWWTSSDAQSFDKLTTYTPDSEISQIISVPTGFIGVGSANTILTSATGLSWTNQTPAAQANFTSVAQSDTGRFVVVGLGGVIQTSLDAITWTAAVSGTSQNLLSVCWGTPGWVAVGANGTVLFSGNGTSWTVVTPIPSVKLNSVVYDGAYYTAVGATGTILKSSNGTVWTPVIAGITENLTSITTSLVGTTQTSVIVGDSGLILISIDNSDTWTEPLSYERVSSDLISVVYGNNLFLTTGLNGTVITSVLAEEWTNVSIPGILTSSSQLHYNEISNTLCITSDTIVITANATINTTDHTKTLNIGYTDVSNVNIRTSTTINGRLRLPVYNNNPSHSVSHGGDIFYDANTGVLKWFDAVDTQWKTVSDITPEPSNVLINGNNTVTLESNGETVFPGNILPANTLEIDLGSSSHRFRDLYLSGNTIYLGDATLSSTNGVFTVDSLVYASEDYVDSQIAAVVGNVPSSLDTLEKIANSINNNSDFSGWVSTELALKANTNSLANVAFTGSYDDLDNTPVFANVAFTGSYTDLINIPPPYESYGNANVVSLLSSFGSNSISTIGNISSNNIVVNSIQSSEGILTLTVDDYDWKFSNNGTFTVPAGSGTGGGDEGGEINLVKAPNSTLNGNVIVFDQYQDRVRFFESDGTNRGAYIDLTQAAAGVDTLLNNRVSSLVDAGVFVTMDNLKVSVTTSGNRGLCLATVSGSIIGFISAQFSLTTGTSGGAAISLAITTTSSSSILNYNFLGEGDSSTYILRDNTNSRVYRIELMIGSAYTNNFISIERLL